MFDNAYNNFYNNNQGSLACDGAKLSSEYFEYRKAGYVTVAGFYCLRTMATTNIANITITTTVKFSTDTL